MGENKGISRKEFLSAWPRQALGAAQSWLDDRVASSDYGAIHCPERCAARGDSRPLEHDATEATSKQVAVLDITRCLAWGNLSCQLCYLACPRREQAIEIVDTKPVLKASGCDGCALCVPACATVNDLSAIKMVPIGGNQ